MSQKTIVFIDGLVIPSDGEKRITVSRNPDYRVQGGTQETHEQMSQLCGNVMKVIQKERPKTAGELREIIRDSAKKVGMGR